MKIIVFLGLILFFTPCVFHAAEPSLVEESLAREGIAGALRGARYLTARQNPDGSWTAPASAQKRIRIVLNILAQEEPSLKKNADRVPPSPLLSLESGVRTASVERYRRIFQLASILKQMENDSIVNVNFPAWQSKMLAQLLKFQNSDGSWGKDSQIISSSYALAAVCLMLQESFSGSSDSIFREIN